MGFFDDLRKEISQAVNEFVSDEELLQEEEYSMDVETEESEVEEIEYFDEDDYIETEDDFIEIDNDMGVVVDDFASDDYVNTLNMDISELVKMYSTELDDEEESIDLTDTVDELETDAEEEEIENEEDSKEDEQDYSFAEASQIIEQEKAEENEKSDTEENKVLEEELVNTFDNEYNLSEAESLKVQEEISENINSVVYNEEDAVINENNQEADMDEREMLGGYAVTEESMDSVNAMVEETAIITKGITVRGDIIAESSVNIQGTIEGNVQCMGKLTISGTVYGNSEAIELFADGAHITGNISCADSIKIGQGSVIVGNVTGMSAVIAGAVKGDIDVQGPVVVDSPAIVMGDIKSKSVQINAGAIIEGRCSQCYADVSPTALFKEN